MKSILVLLITLTSISSFALEKESIYGKAALQIVEGLETLNVKGSRNGSDDAGNVNIVSYSYYGMVCNTAWSDYGGYGSKEVAGCHFEGVKSTAALNKIRSNLLKAGLKKSNPIFQ